ncbi:DsbA family protein [Novosphingobium lindaniclasticum]|uniref:DSBA oxidoreductase n=1 Tax=Novosphingobium lindaniclasticum LE124 TaxID=1096930 RepID=T0HIH7_9SPHN|nr:DsbA family protein [Novosphingobium lindaniclasticum]EQB16156.1 DSBA oxidoreductase [Novosphingobium lindaniclasticum LE124]
MGNGTKFAAIAGCLVAVVGIGGWFGGRVAVEKVVHDYILEHPEILPQAMENLQRKQASQQLAGVRQNVETPFPGAVLGNPDGKVTLVEFSDYACGYCRRSLPDVAQLLKSNPDLRIIVRELPIIGPESPAAARMALAAAEQGKFPQFHDAMFAMGQIDGQSIEAAAQKAGLDLERARKVAAGPAVEQELSRNLEIAQRLGFSGTPSWVAGERLISGAVGVDQLSQAVAEARGGEKKS